MTIVGNAAFLPSLEGGRPERDAGPAGGAAPARTAGPDRQPRIAFVRWLCDHPGKKPRDFEPLIREAEFAYRCRAAFVPACDDLGGSRVTERQLRNLELGLCGGWRVLAQSEARSLSDWLDAVLPHHPWGAVLEWRGSGAQEALAEYCGEDRPHAPATGTLEEIAGAGLKDLYEQACSFATWGDIQSLVLSAWLGGALLVDERGYMVADWKEAFAETLAARAGSLN